MSKFQKLFKSGKLKRKKLLKSRNLLNFDITKAGSGLLIFNAKIALNHLWLAFIKVLIFYYFDLKYHIWVEIDIFGYIINKILS